MLILVKPVVVRVDNIPRNSRNRNTGTSRLRDFTMLADKVVYLAVGEEATRGAAQSVTVGFVPTEDTAFPAMEFDETPRGEARGESPTLGDVAMIRWSQKWAHSFVMPFFTEAGTVAGIVGTLPNRVKVIVTSVESKRGGYHSVSGESGGKTF